MESGLSHCRAALGKVSKSSGSWSFVQLVMVFMEEYVVQLFGRLKEARTNSNLVRMSVGANNPHLATRKVAADVDAAIDTMSMGRACIMCVPKLEDFVADMEHKADAAERILEMLNESMESKLKDISDMLENDLADHEDVGVEASIVKGYGHGDDELI
jgi:hypothetical protein